MLCAFQSSPCSTRVALTPTSNTFASCSHANKLPSIRKRPRRKAAPLRGIDTNAVGARDESKLDGASPLAGGAVQLLTHRRLQLSDRRPIDGVQTCAGSVVEVDEPGAELVEAKLLEEPVLADAVRSDKLAGSEVLENHSETYGVAIEEQVPRHVCLPPSEYFDKRTRERGEIDPEELDTAQRLKPRGRLLSNCITQ
eukprot:758101-Hanusia_phi.AAC.2